MLTQGEFIGHPKWKIEKRQKTGLSGKAWAAWWPLGKDWPVSRFLPISRFQPGGFLPKLTLNDTEIMRGSHFRPSIPLGLWRPHRATLGIHCRNHNSSDQHHQVNHFPLNLFGASGSSSALIELCHPLPPPPLPPDVSLILFNYASKLSDWQGSVLIRNPGCPILFF